MRPAFDPPPPAPRQPIFNVPGVVAGLIAAFVLVHLWQASLDNEPAFNFVFDYALVPARFSLDIGYASLETLLKDAQTSAKMDEALRQGLAQYTLVETGERPWTVVTYAFLHGDFTHLLLNSVWLLAFGTAVARRFGTLRTLLFMLFCTVAAGLTQWISNPLSLMPVIGASGMVSGLMGASLRFMFRDEAWFDRQPFAPRLSLKDSFSNRRVLGFIVMLLVVNLVFASGSSIFLQPGTVVAWQAHLGGLAAGLLGFAFFDPIPAPPRG